MKRFVLATLLFLMLWSTSFAGGAIVLPPNLAKVSGYTVIISGPTPPSADVIALLVSYGISSDNILWRDTSASGNVSVTISGGYGIAEQGSVSIAAGGAISATGIFSTSVSGNVSVVSTGGSDVAVSGAYSSSSAGALIVYTGSAVTLTGVYSSAAYGDITVSKIENGTVTASGNYGTAANGTVTATASIPMSSELRGQWNLANRTYTDLSGNGTTLSENGTIFSVASGHGSGTDLATHFDTNPGYPYLSAADNAALSITGNLTLAGWVKFDTLSTYQMLITKWGTSQQSYAMFFNPTSNNLYCSLSSDGSSQTDAITTSSMFSAGTWYHVACVYNGTDIRVYVNGSLVSNGASNPKAYTSGIKDSTATFMLGNYQKAPTLTLDGTLDDVAVWARALSSTEISTLYGYGDDFEGF